MKAAGKISLEVKLTKTQRDAVTAIRQFRRQRKVGGTWLAGDRRLSNRKLRLVREETVGGNPCSHMSAVASKA